MTVILDGLKFGVTNLPSRQQLWSRPRLGAAILDNSCSLAPLSCHTWLDFRLAPMGELWVGRVGHAIVR